MKTILEVLSASSDYLNKKNIESPRREAELLLADFLNVGRMDLYLDFERPLTEKELEGFRGRLKRRGEKEPGQYIHGFVKFYGLELKVSPDVLIPRPETEILVDKIVEKLEGQDLEGKQLLDLCTGSGCIGLALKKRFPLLNVSLSDVSEKALNIARENGKNLEVEYYLGDLFSPLKGKKFDYIVCNPPYISQDEYDSLDSEVKDFEPKLALLAGGRGVEVYERIKEDLPSYLNPNGVVWFELGAFQGAALLKLFDGAALEKDWAGHDRFLCFSI